MSAKDEEYKDILREVLSTRVYTPAGDFNPKLKGRVPSDKVYDLLKEMAEEGQAELAYGRGWRIIGEPDDPAEAELTRVWKEQVASGLTVLGSGDWTINEAIKAGWNSKDDPKGEHPERVDFNRLKWMDKESKND